MDEIDCNFAKSIGTLDESALLRWLVGMFALFAGHCLAGKGARKFLRMERREPFGVNSPDGTDGKKQNTHQLCDDFGGRDRCSNGVDKVLDHLDAILHFLFCYYLGLHAKQGTPRCCRHASNLA